MIDGASVPSEKKRLRREMKAMLSELEAASFSAAGATVARRLVSSPAWSAAASVFAFLSMDREIGTDDVCRASLKDGKLLFLPRVEGSDLSFRSCRDLSGPWSEGPFGIREPLPDAPLADLLRSPGPVLVVVPALAFDAAGRRLGRGKGYYDRFLRSLRSLRADACAVGIALRCQVLTKVPVGDEDEAVDLLLTD
jgi:5-formyltetrahydrofolate cyclo-ligase